MPVLSSNKAMNLNKKVDMERKINATICYTSNNERIPGDQEIQVKD